MKNSYLVGIFVLLLLCSLVFALDEKGQAQNNTRAVGAEREAGNNAIPMLISAGEQNRTGSFMFVVDTQVHAGLYNALQNVQNENARARMQANMERFVEKYRERLENKTLSMYDGVINESTEEITIKGEQDVKFLGFIKGKAAMIYKVYKDGSITEKKPWYNFLYTQ